MAAQLMATKRCAWRLDSACSPRAISSLPLPESPSSITLADEGATFSTLRHSFNMPGSRLTMPASGESACVCNMRRFSCCIACR
ncbi:hypothetical protein D3C72_1890410 [compost metagenome]